MFQARRATSNGSLPRRYRGASSWMQATSVSVLFTIRTSLTPVNPLSVSASKNTSSRHGVPTIVVRMSRILTRPPFGVVYYARDDAGSRLLYRYSLRAGGGNAARRHAAAARSRRIPHHRQGRRDGPDRRDAGAHQLAARGAWRRHAVLRQRSERPALYRR